MSLITRCLACGTMFKVVPDQLRISEGWVRCGRCGEVFDAAAQLQPDAATPAVSRLAETGGAPARDEDLPSEAVDSSVQTEVGEDSSFQVTDSTELEAQAQALAEHPLDRPFELHRQSMAAADTAPMSQAETEPQPLPHDVSFVREARRKAFWSRPAVRTALVVMMLGLSVTLALQMAVHDRDRLAVAAPALQPWLARLCAPLNCRIGPLRQIEALAIDSSSFNKLRGDAYRLNFTLKNQARTPVAMPALELTLTDGQDRPFLRRVFAATELASNPSLIAAASEWSGSIAVAVHDAGNRVAGYRLLAFYP